MAAEATTSTGEASKKKDAVERVLGQDFADQAKEMGADNAHVGYIYKINNPTLLIPLADGSADAGWCWR